MAPCSPGSLFIVPGDDSIDSVRRDLRDAGLDVNEPTDREEAEALIAEVAVDAIVFAPGDAARIAMTIRSLESRRHDLPPILVLAGYGLGPLEARILYDVGVTDVIFPPHHPTLVLAKVGALLRLQRRLAAARELSMRDELTGLYNRRFFNARLEQEVARAVRSSEGLALVLFDIDHFKKINDTYGHPVGDLALRAIAAVAMKHTRRSDLVARVGGDEFALLLSANTLGGARICADGLLAKIRDCDVRLPSGAGITASFGIACYPHPQVEHPMEDLMREADLALLAAKAGGRDRVATLHDVVRGLPRAVATGGR